jgi:hypothetical protein
MELLIWKAHCNNFCWLFIISFCKRPSFSTHFPDMKSETQKSKTQLIQSDDGRDLLGYISRGTEVSCILVFLKLASCDGIIHVINLPWTELQVSIDKLISTFIFAALTVIELERKQQQKDRIQAGQHSTFALKTGFFMWFLNCFYNSETSNIQ